jgi:SAM-dependent methyltransferase
MPKDRWEDASAYERFMGRWSRALAREFVTMLAVPPAASWLEIGCGTGALTSAICELGLPASVVACDTAADFVAYCRDHLHYPQLSVVPVPPGSLPVTAAGFDAVVSSLVLNFLPAPVDALRRMRDACSPHGCVAACVWDYADGMEFLRVFWDAAADLEPAAQAFHEGARFPLCTPDALRSSFEAAGLRDVSVAPITVPTHFADFDDFWGPFIDGPGPAQTYVASLSASKRQRLADRLRSALGHDARSPIRLRARAWAAKGARGAD